MSDGRLHDLLGKPEWYAAIYGLAAHQFHAATNLKSARGTLRAAEEQALLLSLGCVSAIEHDRDGRAWPEELTALEQRLFPPGGATRGFVEQRTAQRPTRQPIDERYRVRKGDGRRARRKGAHDRRRRDEDPKTERQAERFIFRDFLEDTVEPSALVLLAGLSIALHGPAGEPSTSAWDRRAVASMLVDAVTDRASLNSRWLVGCVAARDDLDGRAHYNLACFYAQLSASQDGEEAEASRDSSHEHLVIALSSTAAGSRLDLMAWARRDPSLRPALVGWDEEHDLLGPDDEPVPKPHQGASQLARLNAIGGYASRLAALGIDRPEELRETLVDAEGVRALVERLDVGEDLLGRWRDVLELLSLDRVGPIDVNLLEAAGVVRVADLAASDADELRARVAQQNVVHGFAARVPSVDEVGLWIVQARARARRRSS